MTKLSYGSFSKKCMYALASDDIILIRIFGVHEVINIKLEHIGFS
jgi:hypothetical protein